MSEMETVLKLRSIDISSTSKEEKEDTSEIEILTVSERVAKLGESLNHAVAARSSNEPVQTKDTIIHQEEKSQESTELDKCNDPNISVAERVAKLGQSLSHAVAARPAYNQKQQEFPSDSDNEDRDTENQELTISDRIDKLGKRLDIKMA